ncbi:MAG: DUF6489 family protein [Pseudomonadota bacterium]
MKIRIDIDCTPQEARTFFGLPDIEPLQDALVAQMQERLSKGVEAMDPEVLMNAWFPGGVKGITELQESFWKQLVAGMQAANIKEDKE